MGLNVRGGAVCLFVAAFAVASASSSARQSALQQQPTFRAGTHVVEVDFYPLREGRIVSDLTRDDVEVFEDGRPQAIEQFEFVQVEPYMPDSAAPDPSNVRDMHERVADARYRVFVLYVDRYHVRAEGAHAMRGPLVDVLQRILGADDLFGVLTTGVPVGRLTFGRRTESIEAQLTEYWWDWAERGRTRRDGDEEKLAACYEHEVEHVTVAPGTTGVMARERWGADGAVERPLIDVLRNRRREDLVLTHLEELVGYLGAIRESRKFLMLFTEGWVLYRPDEASANRLRRGSGSRPGPIAPRFAGGASDVQAVTPHETLTGSSSECRAEALRLFRLDNQVRFRRILELANQHNVTFYPVSPSGIQVFDSDLNERTRVRPGNLDGYLTQELGRVRERRDTMETLATNTDGLAVVDNELATGLRRIVDDVSAYYVLTYASANPKNDGTYRRIEVRVNQPDVRVRARRGYFAPSEPSPRVVGAGTAAPDAAEVEAAFGALARLRPDAPLFSYGVVAGPEAVIVVELTPAQALRNRAGLGVQVQLAKADGTAVGRGEGTVAPGTRGTLVRIPLGVAPEGPWRATITAGSGRERLQDSLEIAGRAGALVGEALVFRATPSPRSPLIPVADSRFRRTERLHVEWPRLAELDRREARLLGRNGQPLAVPVTVTEREVDGRVSVAADLSLAPLTDGEYAIELVVGQGSETERRVVAIRVTR